MDARILAVLVFLPLFAACSLTSPRSDARGAQLETARNSLSVANTKNAAGRASDDDVAAAFADMLNACQASLSNFEARANKLSKWRRNVAIVGAVVGGVAIPALTTAAAAGNAVWISGLGGVAGVTNAAQQSMIADGQTPAAVLDVRENVLKEWREAIKDYYGETDTKKRLDHIQKAVAACTVYSVTISTNGGSS